MPRPTDIRIADAELYFLPVKTRMPLKFGAESLESVVCARAKITVENGLWPSKLTMQFRLERLEKFAKLLATHVAKITLAGHAMEIGLELIENVIANVSVDQPDDSPEQQLPYLAKLGPACLTKRFTMLTATPTTSILIKLTESRFLIDHWQIFSLPEK